MFIKRTTDIKDVLKVVPIEIKLREKEKAEVPTKELLAFVQSQLNNPLFYFIMFFEDESEQDLMAYAVLYVIPHKMMGSQQVNVLRVWYDPKYRHTNIRKVGVEAVEKIARQYNIKVIRAEVQSREKAFMRTFGFKKKSTVLERRIS